MADRYASVHELAVLGGPGDARPTASQIIQDQGLEGGLKGKVILITGVNTGIGLESVRALHKTGATIYGTVRDVAKSQALFADLPADSVHLLELQLDSLESVRKASAEFLAQAGGQLNILITNAGIMAVEEGRTKDGFESQLGVNHLGHFLLFKLLQGALLASASPEFPSRVVTLSSAGHRLTEGIHFSNLMLEGEYNTWVSYGQSKLANVYMASEVERRFGAQNLHAWSVNPGGVGTGLYKHVSEAQMKAWDNEQNAKLFKSPEQGAATSVWAAVAKELDAEPYRGKYLEDCGVVNEVRIGGLDILPGRAPWAYDEESAKKLWEVSLELVGLAE